jgi:hypothetical protein
MIYMYALLLLNGDGRVLARLAGLVGRFGSRSAALEWPWLANLRASWRHYEM